MSYSINVRQWVTTVGSGHSDTGGCAHSAWPWHEVTAHGNRYICTRCYSGPRSWTEAEVALAVNWQSSKSKCRHCWHINAHQPALYLCFWMLLNCLAVSHTAATPNANTALLRDDSLLASLLIPAMFTDKNVLLSRDNLSTFRPHIAGEFYLKSLTRNCPPGDTTSANS